MIADNDDVHDVSQIADGNGVKNAPDKIIDNSQGVLVKRSETRPRVILDSLTFTFAELGPAPCPIWSNEGSYAAITSIECQQEQKYGRTHDQAGSFTQRQIQPVHNLIVLVL